MKYRGNLHDGSIKIFEKKSDTRQLRGKSPKIAMRQGKQNGNP